MVATALANAGAAVGLIARSGAELTETVGAVEAAGGTAAAVVAVTDRHTMGAAVAELRLQLGPVDLLVNNAGMLGPVGPLWENDLDAWWATMDVNLRGVILTSQLVLPELIERRRGRILNITSQAGAFRWPLVSAYSV
jgi:NADP-dependent 3-hydroxy acid dehydrogenase YdfG